MRRIFVRCVFVGHLGNPAEVHDGDATARVAHHRQIMSNVNERQAVLELDLVKQVEHLNLNRHIERRDRFIQSFGFLPGDRNNLALTAFVTEQ